MLIPLSKLLVLGVWLSEILTPVGKPVGQNGKWGEPLSPLHAYLRATATAFCAVLYVSLITQMTSPFISSQNRSVLPFCSTHVTERENRFYLQVCREQMDGACFGCHCSLNWCSTGRNLGKVRGIRGCVGIFWSPGGRNTGEVRGILIRVPITHINGVFLLVPFFLFSFFRNALSKGDYSRREAAVHRLYVSFLFLFQRNVYGKALTSNAVVYVIIFFILLGNCWADAFAFKKMLFNNFLLKKKPKQ